MEVQTGSVQTGSAQTGSAQTGSARCAALLQNNRVFLDFFWDIAKPDQEVRLKAVENLIRYLKSSNKDDELDYTLKRLVDGLAHTREAARPGFSLALGQVLSAFEEVSLQTTLDTIRQKHSLQTVKKKRARNAMFGNLFGVLALHQSSRLFKEPPAVLGCVQLLQSLTQHRQHLKDLPSKTMIDILSEIPEEVFEEVLLEALQADLASAFRTPEQLHLLLVALQRFPQTLKPKKLKLLLGTSTIINVDNIPKLTEVLKMAAHSVKKDCILPAVAMDLLKLSLKEDSFQLFWNKAITEGILKEPPGPMRYLGLRLLGAALPLLSLEQLKEVLSGDVMRLYGEHVVSAQKADRFRLAPEMDTYVSDFLQGCQDSDKQLAVMVGFSSLTNQGYPVVSPVWKVVQYALPGTLQLYVEWLKITFLQPELDQLLDFSTRRQKDHQEACEGQQKAVFRLRKWIIDRLCSVIDNHQVKKDQVLVMDVSRFVFFHAFFSAKKKWTDVPETEDQLSVPLDDNTRGVLVNSFFGLLLSLDHLPLSEDAADGAAVNPKRMLGVTADGTLWLYHLAQYADRLLNQPKYIQSRQPFSCEQRRTWTSTLQSVRKLQAVKTAAAAESRAFQQLFLLLGLHLFKAPEELLDIMKDLHRCLDKAQEKKSKKKREADQEEEPEWVEVMVDILLSLLSLPSRHIRLVCKTVFSSICPDVTEAALGVIMDVLDPEKDEEDSAVVVTDDGETHGNQSDSEVDQDDEMVDDDKSDEDSEDDEAVEEVDQSFRLDLMKVLQQKNALATVGDGSSDEELDDDAMMELDDSLSALFSEQKKKSQAKKEEKSKVHKKKMLVRNFKIKVLDLVEVFVTRQAGSPLVLGLVEPLLTIIDRGMSSDSDQLEQDFLRRVADIFSNKLCRSKVYCRTVGDKQGALHDLLDKLMTKGRQLSDSSVCLYYFSGCLYLVKVLRGAPPADNTEEQTTDRAFMGNMDVNRLSAVFREALKSFLSRRSSPLTTQMFTDLFSRFPVLCVKLLDVAVEHITSGIRQHQQSQACVLVLRAMQMREVQVLLAGVEWVELCVKVTGQLAASVKQVGGSKVEKEKLLKNLQLCQFLLKHIQQQKLTVELEPLQVALQSLPALITFNKSSQLEDLYWNVMKHFGIMKPKAETSTPDQEVQQEAIKKKKKGFLPESKKRRKRQSQPEDAQISTEERPSKTQTSTKKRKQHLSADGATAPQPGRAKKRKMQSKIKPVKKKKQQQKARQEV